jgi:hypothetical protein
MFANKHLNPVGTLLLTNLFAMLANKKAQLDRTVLAIVVVAVTLIIGVIVFEEVSTSINRGGWSAAANSSYTTVSSNTFSGLDLAAVGVIVLAAAAILGIIFVLGARR